jgi:hypothetical protein
MQIENKFLVVQTTEKEYKGNTYYSATLGTQSGVYKVKVKTLETFKMLQANYSKQITLTLNLEQYKDELKLSID